MGLDKEEFSKEKIKTGIYRSLINYFAFILFIVGFFLSFVSLTMGVIVIIIGLLIVGNSIRQSVGDRIALKWFNVFTKSIVFLIGLALLIFRISINSQI